MDLDKDNTEKLKKMLLSIIKEDIEPKSLNKITDQQWISFIE